MTVDQIKIIQEKVKEYLRGNSLFSYPDRYHRCRQELNREQLPAGLKTELALNGHQLSPKARVTREPDQWVIEDGKASYSVAVTKETLYVSLRPRYVLEDLVVPKRRSKGGPYAFLDFENLVEDVRDAIRFSAAFQGVALDDLELRVVIACCVLGPKNVPLTDDVYRSLLKEVRTLPRPDEQVIPCTIAFGCGNWRTASDGRDKGWNGVWEGAYRGLIRLLEHPVREAMLTFSLPADDLWSDATEIAHRLFQPVEHFRLEIGQQLKTDVLMDAETDEILTHVWLPSKRHPIELKPGQKWVATIAEASGRLEIKGSPAFDLPADAKIIISAKDGEAVINPTPAIRRDIPLDPEMNATITAYETAIDLIIWKCQCGHKDCTINHRLCNWDPRKFHLGHFLAWAVKGGKSIRPGSFVQGILFPIIIMAGRYADKLLAVGWRQGDVLHAKCDNGVEAIRTEWRDGVQVGEGKPVRRLCGREYLYNGGYKCPSCGEAVGPGEVWRVAKFLVFSRIGFDQIRVAKCRNETCEHCVEIAREDVRAEVSCQKCGDKVLKDNVIGEIQARYKDLPAQKSHLREKRKRTNNGACPSCGETVTPWQCPRCGCDFSQRSSAVWVPQPPQKNISIEDMERDKKGFEKDGVGINSDSYYGSADEKEDVHVDNDEGEESEE